MRRFSLLAALVLAALPLAAAGEPNGQDGNDNSEDWLVGKTREEVEALLGPPTKVKVRKEVVILRYDLRRRGGIFPEVGSAKCYGPEDSPCNVPRPADLSPEAVAVLQAIPDSAIRRIDVRLDRGGKVTDCRIKTRRAKRIPEQTAKE